VERFGTSDPARDLLIVERRDAIVGFARVSWRDQADGARVATSQCVLRPEARGHGIGSAMLAWVEHRLDAFATEIPDRRPDYRTTFTWSDDPAAAVLLQRRGWRENERGYEMVRPSLDDVPEVSLPPGLEVRTAGENDRVAVWHALVEAFADHRGQGTKSDADKRRFLEDDHMRPDLWVIAHDGDEIAGGVLSMLTKLPTGQAGTLGRVDGVFTRRPWRRRGLARALVARSLALLRAHGATIADLSVDGANPNQAMALYESLGFEVGAVETDWIKPYPAQADTEDER
jgi:mycothiol synthase